MLILRQLRYCLNATLWHYLLTLAARLVQTFYVPEAYIMYFIWRCWFLNCSVQRPVWKGGDEKLLYVTLQEGRRESEYIMLLNVLAPLPTHFNTYTAHVHSEYRIKNTEYRILNTECRIKKPKKTLKIEYLGDTKNKSNSFAISPTRPLEAWFKNEIKKTFKISHVFVPCIFKQSRTRKKPSKDQACKMNF